MIYNLPNNSTVSVCDIFDELPDFMLKADCLFIDPPYNQSLLSNYNYRINVKRHKNNTINFDDFTNRLFEQIQKINPHTVFVEIGKENLAKYLFNCKKLFKNVTFYNSFYLKNKSNKCYIICASNKKIQKIDIEDKDESEIIKLVCEQYNYSVIGDLCMGKGLVGKRAFDFKKTFVGIEINNDRLLHLVEYCNK